MLRPPSPPNQILIEDGHRGLQTGQKERMKADEDLQRPFFVASDDSHENFGEILSINCPNRIIFGCFQKWMVEKWKTLLKMDDLGGLKNPYFW